MRSAISLALILFIVFGSHAKKEDVEFRNGDIKLAGTLYTPKGDGPFPAVVFVHGSGPEDRKNGSYSARWLMNLGYSVLTYDKRGVGKSDGTDDDWSRFSFEALGGDVVAAVEFLASRNDIITDQIGLHATSQGGWVAAQAAADSDKISFMIIKSASVCTVEEDRIFERAARLMRELFNEEDLVEVLEMQKAEPVTADVEQSFESLFDRYKTRQWLKRVYPVESAAVLDDYRTWYATIAYFDPIPLLQQVDIPVFWIFGDPVLDNKGPVALSLKNVNTLKTAGKPYKIMQVDGQDHSVQEWTYETAVYNWLVSLHGSRGYEYKKH